ncbi:hypothetical protein NDU88_003811 [Pleurodeles waltl]|uniref:Uncharacterized protein n=1 Tax=Pleurodeles waltl TaxID=8319 RepID=A0AAV7LI34_PLEWA|nr:hypothetical protein NDU88_003811 [Pleurodeles waltl]
MLKDIDSLIEEVEAILKANVPGNLNKPQTNEVPTVFIKALKGPLCVSKPSITSNAQSTRNIQNPYAANSPQSFNEGGSVKAFKHPRLPLSPMVVVCPNIPCSKRWAPLEEARIISNNCEVVPLPSVDAHAEASDYFQPNEYPSLLYYKIDDMKSLLHLMLEEMEDLAL